VKVEFDNPADVEHNVTLELQGKKVAATQTITKAKASLSTMLKPGSYTFYCSVDGHRQAGMKGTLTVR
jgi:plastocyanin